VRAFLGVPLEADSDGEGEAPARPHLTLRFLGEIPASTVDPLSTLLAPELGRVPSFRMRIEGVGAFPSSDRPRVVWRGITDGAANLREIADRIEAAVRAVGLPPDATPFTPHVTLFRVRSPRDHDAARALLDGRTAPPPATDVTVREIRLTESRLTPRGALHRVRARYPLAEARP
jgi:RNA 2',3'-cyclic 3'-phosphodiesterase